MIPLFSLSHHHTLNIFFFISEEKDIHKKSFNIPTLDTGFHVFTTYAPPTPSPLPCSSLSSLPSSLLSFNRLWDRSRSPISLITVLKCK